MRTRSVGNVVQVAYALLVLGFLFLPIFFVVLFSFDARGIGTFPIEHFSTRWYGAFFDDPTMTDAALNSVEVAFATAIISSVLGTLAAFAFARYRVRFAGVFATAFVMPLVIPALLVGIALLSFFSKADIQLSLLTVIVGHVLITLPFVLLVVGARLANFDRSVEEAASTLGASPLQRFRYVTFPLIRPSLLGAALLVVAVSLDEFVITFFTIGGHATLPIVIWGQMRAGVSPLVNVVSTLMLAATVALVVGVRQLSGVRFR
jgi:spermidine/putrescine transport system permease protein